MARTFFPLRTSVEFFRDPTSVAAVARAKAAAILYDELVFEAGLYDIGITAQGSFANWRPPGKVTPDEIARSRTLPELAVVCASSSESSLGRISHRRQRPWR